MMPAIGFDPNAQILVMIGGDVYPSGALTATALSNGIIQISSIADRVEFAGSYQLLTRLDGTNFSSQQNALDYLSVEFAKRRTVELLVVDGGEV